MKEPVFANPSPFPNFKKELDTARNVWYTFSMPLSTPQHLLDEALRLRVEEGMGNAAIAQRLDLHIKTVQRACKGHPVPAKGRDKFADMLSQCANHSRAEGYAPCTATPSELEEVWTNYCVICGREGTCMDHCHNTGKFRGFICRKCNLGLGYFDDSPGKMVCAAEYLIDSELDDSPQPERETDDHEDSPPTLCPPLATDVALSRL